MWWSWRYRMCIFSAQAILLCGDDRWRRLRAMGCEELLGNVGDGEGVGEENANAKEKEKELSYPGLPQTYASNVNVEGILELEDEGQYLGKRASVKEGGTGVESELGAVVAWAGRVRLWGEWEVSLGFDFVSPFCLCFCLGRFFLSFEIVVASCGTRAIFFGTSFVVVSSSLHTSRLADSVYRRIYMRRCYFATSPSCESAILAAWGWAGVSEVSSRRRNGTMLAATERRGVLTGVEL
ncbi:hypothetical protein DFP72DRAFT_858654 [Ephemerocybe angulata]|uniref:Uncharacterized protein n=1 Tax=Ephemerocybe angulata TaxID=980116 RepID=A0A8H6HD40_9AGAR|nr:hypothetical protein DFP72DRAFT_858654 [Tulosesus angulatus]